MCKVREKDCPKAPHLPLTNSNTASEVCPVVMLSPSRNRSPRQDRKTIDKEEQTESRLLEDTKPVDKFEHMNIEELQRT